MPRPKTASGRRVGWSLRLSEQEASDAEAAATAAGWRTARGLHRSEWLRHLVLEAVAAHRDPAHPRSPVTITPVPVPGDFTRSYALVQPAQADAKPDREQCPHRNWGRYCGGCDKIIARDGFPAAG